MCLGIPDRSETSYSPQLKITKLDMSLSDEEEIITQRKELTRLAVIAFDPWLISVSVVLVQYIKCRSFSLSPSFDKRANVNI